MAWSDYGYGPGSEIVAYDRATKTTTRLTNDAEFDRSSQVSPDGNAIVWEKCATAISVCDIWSATLGPTGWTVAPVTNSPEHDTFPDTNGQFIVYSTSPTVQIGIGGADIRWRPLAGGPPRRLVLPGASSRPAISGSVIVFEHSVTGSTNADIYAYDIAANRLYQVTNTPQLDERLSDVWVSPSGLVRVAWSVRESDQNVYAATFTLPASVPLSIAANNATQVYGAATPALGATYSGFVGSDTPASLTGTLLCTTTATPASPVGTYPINCSGQTSATYAITYAPGTLTITPAPLTIAANNAARPYGAMNPGLTGMITGLQNNDPITASFTTTAGPASDVGTYFIFPAAVGSANVLSNYAIALVNGTLVVGQEPTSLTVTLSPLSIIVGQSSLATVTLTALDMVIPIDPSVLAPITLTSPVVSDILTNNGVCTPMPSATAPYVASCVFSVSSVEPNGRTLLANFPGNANLGPSLGKGDLIVTAALESQKSCLNSDFRNVAVPGGSYLWFNSIFKIKDVTKHKVTITFFQSSVQFKYKDASNHVVTVNQAMPDAKIVFDPGVTTASTMFDSVDNVWITTVPFDLDDASFLTGMPWLVPAGGIPGDIEPVTWCGTFASDTAGLDIGWRWAAAAYSSFSGDNGVLGVKPMDTDRDNPGTNRDRAGTPENFKQFVIPGARGRGGKNYTGTYSRSALIE